MANVSRTGFYPLRTLQGNPWNGQAVQFDVDASNDTAIFIGDVVIMEADGNCAEAAAGSVNIIGVCVGIGTSGNVDHGTAGYWNAANLEARHLAATTAGVIQVCTDPFMLYIAEEDNDTSDLALTDRGSAVDIIAGSGSTTTGISGHVLDSSSASATDGQFKIIELWDDPNNAVGTDAKWVVMPNEHLFKQVVAI